MEVDKSQVLSGGRYRRERVGIPTSPSRYLHTPPSVLTPTGGHQNRCGWQAGGIHPTGIFWGRSKLEKVVPRKLFKIIMILLKGLGHLPKNFLFDYFIYMAQFVLGKVLVGIMMYCTQNIWFTQWDVISYHTWLLTSDWPALLGFTETLELSPLVHS